MADLIQVHYESMAGGAANINTATANIRADLETLVKTANQVMPTWSAASREAFFVRLTNVNKNLDNIDLVLTQSGVHLVNASDSFRESDTAMANAFMST